MPFTDMRIRCLDLFNGVRLDLLIGVGIPDQTLLHKRLQQNRSPG